MYTANGINIDRRTSNFRLYNYDQALDKECVYTWRFPNIFTTGVQEDEEIKDSNAEIDKYLECYKVNREDVQAVE